MEAQNAALATSLENMSTNIKSLTSLLISMKEGSIAVDHDLLRRLAKVCKEFPTKDHVKDRCFANELDQSTIFTCLATYTKSLAIGNRQLRSTLMAHLVLHLFPLRSVGASL